MFEEIITYIMTTALRHKAVRSAQYKRRSLINQQNHHGYMQFVVEDDPFSQKLIGKDIFTVTLNADILGFPSGDYSVLTAQSDAYQVACEIIAKIEDDPEWKPYVSVYDYSLLAVSEFTDDRAAGQRLTLELVVPDPVNLCTLDDNFTDEPDIEPQDPDIDLKEQCDPSDREITLKPVRVK